MQLYVFFSTHLLPRILNDTLHCRPVAEIVEYTYLVGKVPFGVQGQSPGGGLGQSPQKLNVFSFSESDFGIKTGGVRPPSVEDLRGVGGGAAAARPSHLQGRPKRGAAAPRPPWIRH